MDLIAVSKIIMQLQKDKHPKFARLALNIYCEANLSWLGALHIDAQDDLCGQWLDLYNSLHIKPCTDLINVIN